MSQENVEGYRKGNEAFNRGDWKTVAATMNPHVLLRADRNWPEQCIYGRDAVTAFFKGLHEAGVTQADIEEIVDLSDRLLARLRLVVHGPASGVEAEQRYSNIVTVREGRTVFNEFFVEHVRALEALEMRE
jgi:ketosteroid isomerase-like protein